MKLTKVAQHVALASLALSMSVVDAGHKTNKSGSKKIIVKTVPVPVPVPVPIIIERVPSDSIITDRTPGCTVCGDLQTPWMIQNSKTCQDWAMTDARCASKSKYWTDNKFCRFTCADKGMPYDDDVCCDIQEDEVVPTCTMCTNIETPGMGNKGIDCTDLNYAWGRCSDKTSYWADNKFCQSTCYQLKQGYDGDECCPDPTASPTPAPSKSPTLAPSKSPTPAPSKSPTPAPTAKPTKSPTAAPTETTCTICSNKVSPQMKSDGHTCETWPMTEDYCYEKPRKPDNWRYYRYCQKHCSELGLPYGGARCCTEDDINRAADDITSSDDADDAEYPQLMFGENSDELLADCRGDCDSDDECETGLICVQRSAYEAMPGCAGEPSWNTDYCLNPARNFKELAYWGQDGPYGRCAGDCGECIYLFYVDFVHVNILWLLFGLLWIVFIFSYLTCLLCSFIPTLLLCFEKTTILTVSVI